jgi:hypothetical protein
MAKTSRELGLFVPPEKERQLRELDEFDVDQQVRVRRRMMFRWMGWGAVLVLLGQWSIGFVSFFTPKRLGAFGGTVTGPPGGWLPGSRRRRSSRRQVLRDPRARRFLRTVWVPPLGAPSPSTGPRHAGSRGRWRSDLHRQRPLQIAHCLIYNRTARSFRALPAANGSSLASSRREDPSRGPDEAITRRSPPRLT